MNPRNILFVQTAFLGDVVFSTALLGQLRKLFPRAGITALTSPRGGGILAGQPFVDDVILYDKTGRDRGGASLVKLIAALRRNRYDLVVSPHRSVRSGLISFFSGASLRAGFRGGVSGRAYNLGVPFPGQEKIPYRRELALLESLGGEGMEGVRPHLQVRGEEGRRARTKLEGLGARPGRPLAAFVPGTVWPTKKWPLPHFVAAAGTLLEKDVDVAVLGGPAEVTEARQFERRPGLVQLAGVTSLSELPALISCCDVLLAADTGPLHLAMSVGVPVVALFGPTDEQQFEFGPADRCLTADLPCRPCTAHGSRECPEGNWICMPRISADEVVRNLLEVVAAGRAGKGMGGP